MTVSFYGGSKQFKGFFEATKKVLFMLWLFMIDVYIRFKYITQIYYLIFFFVNDYPKKIISF